MKKKAPIFIDFYNSSRLRYDKVDHIVRYSFLDISKIEGKAIFWRTHSRLPW